MITKRSPLYALLIIVLSLGFPALYSMEAPPTALQLDAAIGRGEIETVEKLFNQGIDLNEPNSSRMKPLHVAAYNKHLPLLKWLVRHGADINAPFGCTGHYQPIMWALKALNETKEPSEQYRIKQDIIRYFVEHGAHFNRNDPQFKRIIADIFPSPLHQAIIAHDEQQAISLFEMATFREIKQALMLAAAYGLTHTVDIIIKAELASDQDLHEALERAALLGNNKIVTMILDVAQNKPDWAEALSHSLACAGAQGHLPIVKEILDRDLQFNINIDLSEARAYLKGLLKSRSLSAEQKKNYQEIATRILQASQRRREKLTLAHYQSEQGGLLPEEILAAIIGSAT